MLILSLLILLLISNDSYGFRLSCKRSIRTSVLSMSSSGSDDKKLVPSSYYEVEDLLVKSISSVFSDIDSSSSSSSNALYSIDFLVPGLNPKLEQKAILQLELLFSLLTSLSPLLSSLYSPSSPPVSLL